MLGVNYCSMIEGNVGKTRREFEDEVVRLKTKVNQMLDILKEELPRATYLRVSARFREELAKEIK